MFLWFAVNVDEQLCPLKRRVREVSAQLNAQNQALTLPFHVSLRISAPVDDAKWKEAVDAAAAYFASLTPFEIMPNRIERNGAIVWLRMAENEPLSEIHKHLVDDLQKKFGVPPQPFDDRFIFHSTMFMDNGTQAESAYALLKDAPFPGKLTARQFIIGASATGIPGDYREIRTVDIF